MAPSPRSVQREKKGAIMGTGTITSGNAGAESDTGFTTSGSTASGSSAGSRATAPGSTGSGRITGSETTTTDSGVGLSMAGKPGSMMLVWPSIFTNICTSGKGLATTTANKASTATNVFMVNFFV
ncbi:unnamed protein product [Parnassius mnemosyne]|uniref:Uncharacterized protein n=1 Tax=Parnassius mnemosyne TaxID=213953 RepID=A0AAV1KIV6_9NEOP